MKLWIRQFGLKIWNKIEDHIAGCIAAAIVGILAVLFWEWVTNEHSVELYGWVWLLLCFVFVFLLVHFILTMFRRPKKLKDPADIRNVLSKWWRHAKEQCPDQTELRCIFRRLTGMKDWKKVVLKNICKKLL